MKYVPAVGFSVELLLFAFFAFVAIVSALGVVTLRDPIKGAMSLIVTFFALASLFVLQSAELMGVLEVLVYAGAIMVLFVFVLMLVEDKNASLFSSALGEKLSLPVKVGGVALVVLPIMIAVARAPLPPPAEIAPDFGAPASVGLHFFTRYLFHFELTSLLLLGAIVGAVVISRRSVSKEA